MNLLSQRVTPSKIHDYANHSKSKPSIQYMRKIDSDNTIVPNQSIKSNFLTVFSKQPDVLKKQKKSIRSYKKTTNDSTGN